MLQIYNTTNKRKEKFTPIDGNKVGMYVCGITVYDYCHIGHARVMVDFDVIARYLRFSGYDLNFVRNITDIDDKIINRANELGETVDAVTSRFIDAMHEDERALNVLPMNAEPKATDNVGRIITMIETLIDKGFAYAGDNGDVYYEVNKFAEYGKLSHQDTDSLRSGERVAVEVAKRDPLDFVLWKLAKRGEPSWDSPWGKGRPGWHIECSAMSSHCLGNHFDIHGGGLDLKFPHHENEIAQSKAATDDKFANTWMHLGLVQIDKEKMSKSLGNFFTIREVFNDYAPEVVRYFLLASHYRSPVNYSTDNLDGAKAALERFYTALRDVEPAAVETAGEYEKRFTDAMDDDFNTPVAIAVMFDLAKALNIAKEQGDAEAPQLAGMLKRLAGVLGILESDPTEFLQSGSDINAETIESLIAARLQARADKNYAEADRIRDEITAMGVTLEDKNGETIWRKV
tara:strand:- start:25013 stop:26386 length:1374 start_codon:yes stop_codon:yes gene_type:complete